VEEHVPGKVTIAPEVLVTIIQLTTQEVEGVHQMCVGFAREVSHLLGNTGIGDGVQVRVQGGRVTADLYIIVEHDVNMLLLGRRIQADVTRAIEELVGMEVEDVNVHIEDVHYPPVQA
jgi:uncharacterized alkaline shock family protein YloU